MLFETRKGFVFLIDGVGAMFGVYLATPKRSKRYRERVREAVNAHYRTNVRNACEQSVRVKSQGRCPLGRKRERGKEKGFSMPKCAGAERCDSTRP